MATQISITAPSGPTHHYRVPWARIAGPLRRALQTLCPVLAITLILTGINPILALLPTLYPFYVLLSRTGRRVRRGSRRLTVFAETGIRLLLGLVPAVLYSVAQSTTSVGWVGVGLVAALPATEPFLARVAPGRKLRVTNLPGVTADEGARFNLNQILLLNLLIALAAALVLVAGGPAGAILPLAALAFGLAVAFALDALRRVRESVRTDNNLYAAVEAYAPKFVLYYGVPAGSPYQVGMWIDYLERIGEPFIVILRRRSAFREIAALTTAPVIVRNNIWQLDDVVVPSITTAFYVNNSAPNVHFVRYAHINHVQLLHGDSDKASSFNPVTNLYDEIFVAGHAAIDRYANNGVVIPRRKFTIVGRPQVETVEQVGAEGAAVRSVLYAPTWEGHYADTNYGSLPVGPDIVRALLKRGRTVIFRPHPYSYRNPQARMRIQEIHALLQSDAAASGRDHLWGQAAEKDLDAFGCFNRADAMISDVSSVVPDFLHSGKPYALVTMTSTAEEFVKAFPLARSAYVIRRDLANLDTALDDLLERDPKRADRRQTRVDYLGPFSPENYADNFVQSARHVIHDVRKPAALTYQPATGGREAQGGAAGETGGLLDVLRSRGDSEEDTDDSDDVDDALSRAG